MMNSLQLPHPLPNEAAAEILRRRAARRTLLDFTIFTKPDYVVNWHHHVICRKLDDFVAGRIRRLMIFCPPQSGKSQLVSRHLPAYVLGLNPDARIIACSHTASLASDMNRDVQRIVDDDSYRLLFPETMLFGQFSRSSAKFTYQRNSDMFEVVGYRGYYRSAGVGGAIAGKGFGGIGGGFGIIDDPFPNREAADSPTQREAVWRWFHGDFMTRAGPNAGVLLTHTRFHKDDLAGRLLKLAADNPTADQWEVICFPAICEIEGLPDDPRRVGEPLWPARKSLAELDAIRAASPYEFFSQHQQHPMPQGGVEWPESYFESDIWFDDWPTDLVLRVLALDPSKGKGSKGGDPSAFVLIGLDTGGFLWVDADVSRRTVSRIVEDGLAICRSWAPAGFAIEINQFQELLGTLFLDAARKTGDVLPLYGITNTSSKEVRIRQLGPHLAQKRMRFKRGSPGARLLVDQLKEFTGECKPGVQDDAMDAAQMGIVMLNYLLGRSRGDRGEPELLMA